MEAADVEVDLKEGRSRRCARSAPRPRGCSSSALRGVQAAAFHWDFRDKVQSAGRGTRRPVNGWLRSWSATGWWWPIGFRHECRPTPCQPPLTYMGSAGHRLVPSWTPTLLLPKLSSRIALFLKWIYFVQRRPQVFHLTFQPKSMSVLSTACESERESACACVCLCIQTCRHERLACFRYSLCKSPGRMQGSLATHATVRQNRLAREAERLLAPWTAKPGVRRARETLKTTPPPHWAQDHPGAHERATPVNKQQRARIVILLLKVAWILIGENGR